MKILVLNSGSSSQKSALFELGDSLPQNPPVPLWQGTIEWGAKTASLRVRTARSTLEQETTAKDRQAAVECLLKALWTGSTRVITNASEIAVVGHRIVHGGHKLDEAVLVNPAVKKVIEDMAIFAPLHNRAELEGIEIIERMVGKVRQVAVFDTGFHHTLPAPAALYPGPYEWFQRGIRRYGFHGINHEYCAHRAAQLLDRHLSTLKIVSCHLGNGCSLAAIDGGKSVDTTMGFTPLDGIMMGTRSGSVDPGILTYLMRQGSLTGKQLDDVLNQKSGLLGVSGVSSDMREILAAIQGGHERAKLAFETFVHRLQSGIGAMAAVLGGLDVLVFTAGIGEHSPEVRNATCQKLGFLGVSLDRDKNRESPPDQAISSPESKVSVLIVRAQEDWAIAQACWKLAHN